MELYCKDCWHFGRCSACGRTVDFAVNDGVCRDFDEVKPLTNAQKIRAMSDEELAAFLASKFSDLQAQQLFGEPTPPTATELMALSHTWYCQWMYWLKEPAEEETNDTT